MTALAKTSGVTASGFMMTGVAVITGRIARTIDKGIDKFTLVCNLDIACLVAIGTFPRLDGWRVFQNFKASLAGTIDCNGINALWLTTRHNHSIKIRIFRQHLCYRLGESPNRSGTRSTNKTDKFFHVS